MAMDAQSLDQSSGSTSSGVGRRVLYLLFTVAVGFFLYKVDWWVGTFWLLLASLLYIWFLLPDKHQVTGLWLWVFATIVTIISSLTQGELVQNPQLLRTIRDNTALSFLVGGYGESVFWAVVAGVFISVLVLGLLIFSATYIAAVFVLNLPEFNGASRIDAIRYVLMLLLGLRLPVITIENGQAIINEKSGKLADVGGPGMLTIKEGNVVVLERKGKISRIVIAGAQKMEKGEKIRNILTLIPQGNSKEFENVLTRDGIPLKITFGMGYQIEPAADSDKRPEARMAPDGVALTKRLDDGLHQVYEGTIRKAALISQRDWSKWKDAAGSLPEDNLRDHILSHNLDELFELAPAGIGGTPAVRVNERRTYEIEQTIKEEIALGRLAGLGVVIKGVDIKTLEYPPKLKTAIIESMSSNKRAFGQAEAIQRIGNVKTDAIQDLFEGILNLIAAHMPYADQEIVRHLVGVLQTTYQEALTDDVLAKDFLEANSDAIQKLAESDGPKHLTAGMFPDPSHVGKRHSGNGRP